MKRLFEGNPFIGYLNRFMVEKKKLNPVHEIVEFYHQINKTDSRSKEFYVGRYSYPKLCREAKELYEALNKNLDDCFWAISKMHYKATKGKFDWSISTCLKYDLSKP